MVFYMSKGENMSLIQIRNLSFKYETNSEVLFNNINLDIDTNWNLGFTGRNGRGKTSFFNLLLNRYDYTGTIQSNVEFEMFPYVVEDSSKDTLSIIQEIAPTVDDWEIERECSLLDLNESILKQNFSTLSKGEQTKVLLVALFLKQNKFLLIDEPTNHLDQDSRIRLSQYLKNKTGFILISHDRHFLDECIDHILVINKNNIEIQKGNFSSWWINKENQDNFEIEQNTRLKKDIKKLKHSAIQKADWSDRVEKTKVGKVDKGYIGHKAAKMMKRSKNIERRQNNLIEEKTQLLKNIESQEDLKLDHLYFHSKLLIDIKDLDIIYDDRKILSGINLELNRGDRLAIKGRNGSGKSSIIKLIMNESINHSGYVYVAESLQISYLSQSSDEVNGTLKDYAEKYNIEISLFFAILRKMDFSREQFDQDCSNFSAGQKRKIMIARSLCEKAHLYIWDEPLNYIDVFSRIQIENLLLKFEPTLIFIEHDAVFVSKVANKIIEL